MVYWVARSTHDHKVVGSNPINAWQDNVSTLLFSTQEYQWVPGRMRTSICECICQRHLCDRAARQGILPREWKLCTGSAALKLYPMTGVIIMFVKRLETLY